MAREYVANVRLREIARSVRGTGLQSVLGVTLPAAALVRLGWKVGDRLDVWIVDDAIVVRRVTTPVAVLRP